MKLWVLGVTLKKEWNSERLVMRYCQPLFSTLKIRKQGGLRATVMVLADFFRNAGTIMVCLARLEDEARRNMNLREQNRILKQLNKLRDAEF